LKTLEESKMIFSISLWPLDAGDRTAQAIAEAVDQIDRSGLKYQLTAMNTLIEGSWDEVMGLVGRCQAEMEQNYGRTYCVITGDNQPGGGGGEMEHNVRAVEKILGRDLKH
jgi:uncharacterized protein YqgV (UPF0045/DUF77 family)